PPLRFLRHHPGVDASHSGTDRGTDHRRGGRAGLRVDAPGPGTAHPPGKSHFQHLLQPGPQCPGRGGGHVGPGETRDPGHGPAQPAIGPLRPEAAGADPQGAAFVRPTFLQRICGEALPSGGGSEPRAASTGDHRRLRPGEGLPGTGRIHAVGRHGSADQRRDRATGRSIGGIAVNPGKKLIFELSKPGRVAYSLPEPDVPAIEPEEVLPEELLRDEPPELPEVSEPDLVRHYIELSRRNYGVDNGFYPLGSCTMKYNPKVHEDVARLPGFARIHPYQPEETVQGALQLMYELQQYLAEITG